MKRVKGKVAVVTGGALGVGREARLLLVREGAKVAVTDCPLQSPWTPEGIGLIMCYHEKNLPGFLVCFIQD